MTKAFQPPSTVTPVLLSLAATIAEMIVRLQTLANALLHLRNGNRMRTIIDQKYKIIQPLKPAIT